ncbi:MAG: hypothetical protein HYZ49_06870 [Chloroflexi bacterium]|nr:hypothetical protein [Chloroflexota bacterium]
MRWNKSTWGWYLRVSAFVVAGLVLVLVSAAVLAQTEGGERYFDETGHAVRGPFLKFFDEHGGLEIFGFPITDEYVNENGRLVQYFQRARFEWHPENPADFQVQLGLLGDQLGYSRPRLEPGQIPAANNPHCKYFPETGHSVCYAFLDYFKAKGGLDVFGYPISEAITQSDRIIQYFQRAQMEWHPEKPTNQKVQLALIGSVAFDILGEDRDELLPKPSQLRNVTSLTTWASVQKPVTGRTGSQTIYVYVGDQHKQAIQGALVTAIVHFASGDQSYTLALTDTRGLTHLEIPFGQTRPGERVSIDIDVKFRNLNNRTRTSFLPWW